MGPSRYEHWLNLILSFVLENKNYKMLISFLLLEDRINLNSSNEQFYLLIFVISKIH